MKFNLPQKKFFNNRKEKLETAFEIIADILDMKKISGQQNVYEEKGTKKRYKLTKRGFEPENHYNNRLKILKLEKQIKILTKQKAELEEINETLVKRKDGLSGQLAKCHEITGKQKKERGFINKLLKEVVDKNIALEKRYQRQQKLNENMNRQLENLKISKANLLDQYNNLVSKSQEQKKQIQELQKALTARKITPTDKN
jgi:chromosome segregation ATPase